MQADRIDVRFGILLLIILAATWSLALRARAGKAAPEPGRAWSQGLVYLSMYLVCIFPPAIFLIFFSLLGWRAAMEWFDAFPAVGAAPRFRVIRGLLAVAALALPWIGFYGQRRQLGATCLLVIGGLLALQLAFLPRSPVRPRIWAVVGGFGCALALNAFVGLRQLPAGGRLCLFAFFTVNLADTSAYVCGKLFGRHRLAPRLSPGKTIEGSLGSLVVTIGAALLFNWVLELGFSWPQVATDAVLLNLLGQAGDLLTSGVKRRVGIKDFGTLLPGHGGVLDRFDSCLLAVPVFLSLVKSAG